ncbi:MAG: glycosyltransferase family 4 protein [Flavobacteriales bacterium]
MKSMLVLYRELAGYFMNVMDYLAENHQVKIDIIAYPIAAEAPFRFENSGKIRIFKRQEMDNASIQKLIDENNYDLIFCGGWSDEGYIQIVKNNKSIPSLIGFDKQWLGSTKDQLATLYLRWKVKPHFNFAFVPGMQQKKFAMKMGFKSEEVHMGAYVGESARFESVFQKRLASNQVKKKIFFVGRYAPEKNIQRLWQAFTEWKGRSSNEWELHCIGTGVLWEQRPDNSFIFHHGFLQGDALLNTIEDGAVFILPSHYEPWGVVVNEFAQSGYALALTPAIGAATYFNTPKNCWMFEASSSENFIELFERINATSTEQLLAMGVESHKLAADLNEEQYAQSILKMMK